MRLQQARSRCSRETDSNAFALVVLLYSGVLLLLLILVVLFCLSCRFRKLLSSTVLVALCSAGQLLELPNAIITAAEIYMFCFALSLLYF